MNFDVIDIENWKRKEYYYHFTQDVPCTYSMTVKLDITDIVNKKYKLYAIMLHALTSTVNMHMEFRTAMDAQGRLGVFSDMLPCYTIFNKHTQAFVNVWTPYSPSLSQFCQQYDQDVAQYSDSLNMNAKPHLPPNTFCVSMIPWVSFDSFNLNLQKGYDYLLPIFTMGKYYEDNGKIYLPLSVQVHHAVCDGYHVGKFLYDLQQQIANAGKLLGDKQ